MSTKSARMARLAESLRSKPVSNKDVKTDSQQDVKLKQMTIKLAPEVRGRLLQESLRRKAAEAENWPIQQIVTEALAAYLSEK